MKNFWLRCKIFAHYVQWAFYRWTKPRVYVIQYTYTDRDGNQRYDAHVVRAVDFDIRGAVAYLQQNTPGNNLIIMGISEVPCSVVNAPIITTAKEFVKHIDDIADSHDPSKQEEEEDEQEDDDEDPLSMLG